MLLNCETSLAQSVRTAAVLPGTQTGLQIRPTAKVLTSKESAWPFNHGEPGYLPLLYLTCVSPTGFKRNLKFGLISGAHSNSSVLQQHQHIKSCVSGRGKPQMCVFMGSLGAHPADLLTVPQASDVISDLPRCSVDEDLLQVYSSFYRSLLWFVERRPFRSRCSTALFAQMCHCEGKNEYKLPSTYN